MNRVVRTIIRMLEEKGIEYRITEHKAVHTSQEAARVRGVSLRQGVKAMVLKTQEGKFVLALVPADQKVDLKKIAGLEGTKRMSLADPDEVFRLTGCRIGAVPPFGHKTRLKTYLDERVLENERIDFNCGEHTRSVQMSGKDLLKVVEAELI